MINRKSCLSSSVRGVSGRSNQFFPAVMALFFLRSACSPFLAFKEGTVTLLPNVFSKSPLLLSKDNIGADDDKEEDDDEDDEDDEKEDDEEGDADNVFVDSEMSNLLLAFGRPLRSCACMSKVELMTITPPFFFKIGFFRDNPAITATFLSKVSVDKLEDVNEKEESEEESGFRKDDDPSKFFSK